MELYEWPMPTLDYAGQEAFWSRQAKTYSLADMTRDNDGELTVVRSLCEDFVAQGYWAQDLVALGGANGCRDPVIVSDALEQYGGGVPREIFFNDLSLQMTAVAARGALAGYKEKNVSVHVLPGPIHEVAAHIPALPRRVIIGVYGAWSLIRAAPHEDYPRTGLEEYLANAPILGDRFIIEPLAIEREEYVSAGPRAVLFAQETDGLSAVSLSLSALFEGGVVDAVRVISQHRDQFGYFLSHWFMSRGISALLGLCFGAHRMRTLQIVPCAKGFVLCIDPVERPQGIVTLLNNVIGNVLPHEQMETLRAVDRLST